MALKNLSTVEMVALSGPWVDGAAQRPHLESHPLLAALLPALEAAHRDLMGHRRHGDDSLARIAAQLELLDARHDRKARGIFFLLTALGDLEDDPRAGRHLFDLRDKLLPRGLAMTQLSYAEEAAHAASIAGVLDEPDRHLLARLRYGERTLADEVDAWVATALELGRLESERAALAPGTTDDGDGLRARNTWTAVVHALLANLDLTAGLDAATRERIAGPVRAAEARADRGG